MGVDSYLVASTVHLAIGQRLVRKLCIECIGACKACDACQESGFRGRIGINEVLVVDDEVREAILRKESAVVIKKIAIKNGMTTMLEDGMHKVAAGLTTKEEVLRVINE
jgi:type II secretory ATPase GspE/PulE/Tfp pilus assembly ATPase PilB-like protein